MFFRRKRKRKLRKEFDEKLINQILRLKKEWDNQNHLLEKSFDPLGQVKLQAKISRAKYILLLREARKRKINAYK